MHWLIFWLFFMHKSSLQISTDPQRCFKSSNCVTRNTRKDTMQSHTCTRKKLETEMTIDVLKTKEIPSMETLFLLCTIKLVCSQLSSCLLHWYTYMEVITISLCTWHKVNVLWDLAVPFHPVDYRMDSSLLYLF